MEILFIDDNSTVQRIYYSMLLNSGFIKPDDRVDFFCSTKFVTESAINLDNYQVIICDLDLGNDTSNGLQFFEHINERFKGVKILFTADSSPIIEKIIDLNRGIKLVVKANPKKKMENTINELGKLIALAREVEK